MVVVDVLVRFCLHTPPGLGWEVITAHKRKCADDLLTRPDRRERLTYYRQVDNPTNCYVRYGFATRFEPVSEANKFTFDDKVGAAPLAINAMDEEEEH